jgi:hypothetical protein
MTAHHARDVLAVYQAGLDTGNANVETVAPFWQQWDADHPAAHRFVATDQHAQLLGWIAACPVSTHCLYSLSLLTVSTHCLYSLSLLAASTRCVYSGVASSLKTSPALPRITEPDSAPSAAANASPTP